MASIRNTLLAALALAYTTSAIPLAIEQRDPKIWTETVWTTVDVTTTVWVEPTGAAQQPPAAPAAATNAPVVQPVSSAAASSPPQAAPAAPANSPAAFAAEPVQSQPAQPSQQPAATPYTPPAAAPSAPSAAPAPASSSYSPPAAAAPSSPPASGGSSSGGPCQGPNSGCTGDITHWDGGLGACGWNVNTNSDMQIALPYQLMGTLSNNNPYCGRSLSIKGPAGNIVQATVGDKCMGCTGDSIDLTDALFNAVAPNGNGRVHDIQWWFN